MLEDVRNCALKERRQVTLSELTWKTDVVVSSPSFIMATYSNDKSGKDSIWQVQIFQFANVGI